MNVVQKRLLNFSLGRISFYYFKVRRNGVDLLCSIINNILKRQIFKQLDTAYHKELDMGIVDT